MMARAGPNPLNVDKPSGHQGYKLVVSEARMHPDSINCSKIHSGSGQAYVIAAIDGALAHKWTLGAALDLWGACRIRALQV